MAILPSPLGSNANPIRGAGLNKCPERQPAFEEELILTVGKLDPGTRGRAPPAPPHWTKPFRGLPVFCAFCTREPSPLGLNAGSWPTTKALGLKLKACLYRSR